MTHFISCMIVESWFRYSIARLGKRVCASAKSFSQSAPAPLNVIALALCLTLLPTGSGRKDTLTWSLLGPSLCASVDYLSPLFP